MTDTEIKLILQELHGAGLANEPKDPTSTISIWRDFFGCDDFRIIGKAVGMHLKKSHFWPAPADIEDLKQRAQWLIEMEDEKTEMMRQLSIIIAELHQLQLVGEPEDLRPDLHSWYSWFNAKTIDQVRTAVSRYLELSKIWPTPMQLSKLIPTVEEQKKLNALGGARTHTNLINKQSTNQKTQPPRAPAIQIEEKHCELHSGSCVMMFSDMCDGPQDGKCPYEGL